MDFITSENILLVGSTVLIAGVLLNMTFYMGVQFFELNLGFSHIKFVILQNGFNPQVMKKDNTSGIQFNDMHTAQFIGMIALCIILFAGGMDTKLSAIKPVIVPGLILSTAGVMLTALLTWLYCSEGVWNDTRRTWKVNTIKTINLSVKSFLNSDLQNRASALTYNTLLAIVPALALLFAIGRGFKLNPHIKSHV